MGESNGLRVKTPCLYCAAGYPESFCLLSGKCFEHLRSGQDDEPESLDEILTTVAEFEPEEKPEKVYKDPISTGRKRAAELYPIKVGQVCEWAWKKNCGGGVSPITGCTGRPATHIHHGPDKSTFNNDRQNISIICSFCHNRWHAANDRYYEEPRPSNGGTWIPTLQAEDIPVGRLDEIQKASKEEILLSELAIPERGKDKS